MQRQSAGGRSRAGLFLAGSIVLALLASFIVFNMIRKTKMAAEEAAQKSDQVNVVVARRDLFMGNQIPEDAIALQALPVGAVPEEGVFHTLADVTNRTPKERILGNEIIREERLANAQAGVGLNAIISPGKRAMTLVTDTEQAVAGLVQAGNYVDVIVAIKPEDPAQTGAKWVSETIIQGIKVLAVGGSLNPTPTPSTTTTKSTEKDADGKPKEPKPAPSTVQDPNMARKLKPSITLEVSPEEAEKLALAQSQGDIYVTLRSDTDIVQFPTDGFVTVNTLIGRPVEAPAAAAPPKPDRPAAAAPAPAAEPAPTATVIQGSKSTEYVLGGGGAQAQDNKSRKNH